MIEHDKVDVDMNTLGSPAYLISASLDYGAQEHEYPFNLSAVRNLGVLEFHPRVTFFVGENGSGKSTLIEAIALALGFNAEGGSRNFNFSTKATHSSLYRHLKIVRGIKRPRDGFFLRAESFYNVVTAVDELDADYPGLSLAAGYGGKSLHSRSHGESFMSLIRHRFHGSGVYILDEPEAALSASRQMEFLSLIHELLKKNSQLVIATHSPILLSYPDALIYQIDEDGIRPTTYEETEPYQLTKYFLNNTTKMLDNILDQRG